MAGCRRKADGQPGSAVVDAEASHPDLSKGGRHEYQSGQLADQ